MKVEKIPLDFGKDIHASVGLWMVTDPNASFVRQWMVSLIHLRPELDLEAPAVHIEGATHELMSIAMNPNFPDVTHESLKENPQPHFLAPLDIVLQFTASDDEVAVGAVQGMLDRVEKGELTPCMDSIDVWGSTLADLSKDTKEVEE